MSGSVFSLQKRQPMSSPSERNLFQNEGYEFMNAVFDVHRELGGGMAEEIYQESLEFELSDRKNSLS